MSRAVPATLVTRNWPLRWSTAPVEPAFCPITRELVSSQKLVPMTACIPPLVPLKNALALVRLALQVMTGKMGLAKFALSAAAGTMLGDQFAAVRKSPPIALVQKRS